MRTMKELVTVLNECVHVDAARNKLVFDSKMFEYRVPNKRERDAVMRAIQDDPPQLLPYRNRFCQIEYVVLTRRTGIAVVIDKDGKAVLITCNGKVVWEAASE